MPEVNETSEPQSDGFVNREVEQPQRSKKKRIVVRLADEGTTIDWNEIPEDDRELLMQLMVNDSEALTLFASHLQEKSGPQVADTTVVGIANAFLVGEAAMISFYGPRVVPVLKNLPFPVAMKACTVTAEEMAPVMDAGKRVVARWVPEGALKFQDELILLEHIGKLSAAKFKGCIELAMKIEHMKRTAASPPPSSGPTPINAAKVNGSAPPEEKLEGQI